MSPPKMPTGAPGYAVWVIHPKDIRKSRLVPFSSARERDLFCSMDPLRRVPLETCEGLPYCLASDDDAPPPKVRWISYEKREVKP